VGANAGHAQLGGDGPQVLYRSDTTVDAVSDEADCLVVPLPVEVIQSVLERRRRGVVVLRRHQDITVKPSINLDRSRV